MTQTSPVSGSAEVRDMIGSIPELWGGAGHVTLPDAAFDAIARVVTKALDEARGHAQSQQDSALRELLEFWVYDGRLQTFEDRERFRKAARAAIADTSTDQNGDAAEMHDKGRTKAGNDIGGI
jgi:hypothetical protein